LSLVIPSGVAVLGGFAGGETNAVQRNPTVNAAVLSGDLMLDDGEGVWDHTGENSWHVVRFINAGPGTLLDGVTIRDGLAFIGPEFIDQQGAGILIEGGTPIIRNCILLDSAAEEGGGIAVVGAGQPLIEDCCIAENHSQSNGTGVYLGPACNATIRRCTIEENQGRAGVGVFIDAASPLVEDCDFVRNTSPIGAPSGAGIGGFDGAPVIRRCRFIENQSQGGGGIHLVNSQPTISRCRFVANIGTGDGGDAVVLFNGASTISNCEFIGTGDRTDLDPSGVLLIISQGSGAHRVVNCTFANNGNSAGLAGSFSGHSAIIAGTDGGLIRFESCVVWGNASALGSGQIVAVEAVGSPVFDRCLVQGWDGTLAGTGSFSLDPTYVDADGIDGLRGTSDDDVRLAAGSPCIDAGINAAVPAGEPLDIAGLPRLRDDPATADTGIGSTPIVDLGAHEFQPPPCAGDANGDGVVDFGDITFILANWGSPFGFADITQALAAWGSSCT
jgi:hypothetical protein